MKLRLFRHRTGRWKIVRVQVIADGHIRHEPVGDHPTHDQAMRAAMVEVGLGTPGHSTYMSAAGNGYDDPLEEWCTCSCGEQVWGWMQTADGPGISGEHDDPWDAWREHLHEVGLTPANPTPMEAP